MDLVRCGFGLSCCLSYPLMVWEARHNIDLLAFGERPYKVWRPLGLTVSILTLALVVGMNASGIETVLELVGSTCSPCMVFILPALFYLKSQEDLGPWLQRRNLPALGLLAWGCLLVPASLFIWWVV